ncbi:MAG: TonB-dependent receptor [Bacteroidia bacterium]|nr:TonB-dependent receptor [Bacteroidia bacterium]
MTKFFCIFLVIFLIILQFIYAQKSVITGKVTDAANKEPLYGVNIILSDKTGTATDMKGTFSLKAKPGNNIIGFYYMGYKDFTDTINLTEGQPFAMDIRMEVESKVMKEIVVSGGKREQKLSDMTISMEVIKPQQIENRITTSMENALNHVPGIDIMDDQPSIRGGGGYCFGAGSRVMVLVDNLPIIAPDAGDVKWDFLPVENISQIEVIKGAASALFGSSALNGVINLRTAFPSSEPLTKFSLYNGLYMNPERKELVWWGNTQPLFSGANFFHSRKIGSLDLVAGIHAFTNDGYRKDENEERARTNVNLRYRNKKIYGLTYGINSNFMYNDKKDFFMWENDSTGGYTQMEGAAAPLEGTRMNVDPYVNYFDRNGNRHSLNTRYFRTENDFTVDNEKDNKATMFYGEYQYQKNLINILNWTAGFSGTYSVIDANLYGDHYSSNFAFFSQFDKKIKNLSLSLGLRAEYYRIDSTETMSNVNMLVSDDTLKLPVIPVFRSGLNYQLLDNTYLRASFGQGFRFPSIAEKYTSASISALRIFPNPRLEPERGWSAEAGIMQGLKISNWNGYIDIAGFWTEYINMMEFTFGPYDTLTYEPIDTSKEIPHLYNLGFQARNVGQAQITGVDITLTGKGEILGLPANIMVGYVYINPIDLTVNLEDDTTGEKSNVLKYRYYHSAKGDIELNYKKLSAGISFMFNSRMVNIDEIFLQEPFGEMILPGFKDYREKNNKGYVIWDYRMAYRLPGNSKVTVIVQNIFNKEYMTRPGDIRPPRNIAIQYSLCF